MNEISQCCRVLQVKHGASLEEVKKAYRDLVQVWHPDRFTENERLQDRVQEQLKEINLAYEYLVANAFQDGFLVEPVEAMVMASQETEAHAAAGPAPSEGAASPEKPSDWPEEEVEPQKEAELWNAFWALAGVAVILAGCGIVLYLKMHGHAQNTVPTPANNGADAGLSRFAADTNPALQPADRINIVAKIDGSDELHISQQSTRWVHKSWDYPTQVQINGRAWNPQQTPVITPGPMSWLPRKNIDLSGAELHKVRGRGSVQLSHDAEGLVISFDDPENGADIYEVNLDFAELLAAKKPEVTNDVELHIQATIDGTDSIYFAQHNAHWYHYDFQLPTDVTLNGLPWDVAKRPDWPLQPAFAPETLDLQKASVARLAGRGWIHLQYQAEFLRLDLEDPAPGAGNYDAILRVPPCQQRYLVKIQAAPNDALLGAALNIYRTTEKDETLALAPGQRVLDERGQCLVALESGQYQFEVVRQPDSQTLVALKTDSINITGPTNINLLAAPADPQLYGPGDQQMVMDDLFIRSARPTGGVHWQTSPNSKVSVPAVFLSEGQTYKIHVFGHSGSNYVTVWTSVTAQEMSRITLAPDQWMSCSFAWRDGTPRASQKGVALQFPDGDMAIAQPETARLLTNRRFFNLSYWLAFPDNHKAVFQQRAYLLSTARTHKIKVGGPLHALASAAILPDEGLKPPTAQHLWWDITLGDPENHLLDASASKLDWKPVILTSDGRPVKVAPLLPDDVKRLGNLRETLIARAYYWLDDPQTISLRPALFAEFHSARLSTETPPYYDWNTRVYLSKAERELDYIGRAGNEPLAAKVHLQINWWFNNGGVGGGNAVRMPIISLTERNDWYTHPWGIAHEMMHNFGYGHTPEMDRMDRETQDYMEQFRFKVADDPDYAPEDSAELIKLD